MFVAAATATPRGIDRVDMGYAGRLFAAEGGHVGLLPSPGRMGMLTTPEAARLVARVQHHWREDLPAGDDRGLAALSAALLGGPRPPLPASRRQTPTGATLRRYAGMLAAAQRSPWRPAVRAVPRNAVYINTGQILLGWPWAFGWLARRPDVRAVFLVHDVIPLLYPEYTGPAMTRHHAAAMRTVARHAAALIATTRAVADEIAEAAARAGRPQVPIHVVPLPVSASLLAGEALALPAPAAPYFVVVGTLDQRKNHLLLLHAWRAMAATVVDVPKLVIIGSRGLRMGGLAALLDRAPALAGAVVEANGLSTPAMRTVIGGARAVLMPSFTEGFGLPIIEALALGTPVIASDIPVHREVGGALCTYLHPLDAPGWMREIMARSREGDAANRLRRARLERYGPQSWDSYFDAVMPILDQL